MAEPAEMSWWDRRQWEKRIEAEHKKLVANQSPAEREKLEHLHRLHELPIEAAWRALNPQRDRAAASTVEALAFQTRAGGADVLRKTSAQRRLAQLDEGQVRELCGRLTKERWGMSKNGEQPPRVPPWKPDEIGSLVALWSNLHG
jgi:hypothetical protein